MRSIRVAIVDDHALLRDTLGEQLASSEEFEVVGAGSDGEEAIRLAREANPDILVMDVDMPGINCFDAAKRVAGVSPGTRVAFLSAHANDTWIEQAIAVGAAGYITKDVPAEDFARALRTIASGERFFSNAVIDRLAPTSGDTAGARPLPAKETEGATEKSRLSTLTPRETEVLGYIARGLAKKEIAGLMHIGTKTVEKHAEHVMSKLGIHDRVGLARFAIREGLAEP